MSNNQGKRVWSNLNIAGKLNILNTVTQDQLIKNITSNNANINNIIDSKVLIIDNKISNVYTNLDTTKIDLETTKGHLDATKTDLETTKGHLDATKTDLETTKGHLDTTNTNLTNVTNNFTKSQELLFSEKNILFEDGFNSINEIKLCTSIVIRIKHIINNTSFDYLISNNGYNYAKIIRPELDALFAANPDLVTKVLVQSTYPNESVFNYNNIVYDKHSNYSLNDFDNLDILKVTNINKTIISVLNSYANDYLSYYLNQHSTATEFYSIKSLPITEFNSMPQVAYLYFKFNQDKKIWSVICAVTNLTYNSIITDNNNAYSNFIEAINTLLNNWSNINSTDIIEYKSALLFESTKCLYSANYPNWTGNYLINLHKNNTEYDIVSEYNNTINSLWYSYPALNENDIVILSGFMGEEYYCNIVKIITYQNTKCFIQQKLDIRPFYPDIIIKNDITINGTFMVKNSKGENIIQTDNIKNIISFNDKIGVNQEIYNIKGLVDIDNLSNKSVDIIMSNFSKPLLDSYTITEQLKQFVSYNGITNSSLITSLYNQYNCVFLFVDILQSIEDGDLNFVENTLNSSKNMFSQKKITFESFAKIKQIVTELYTMIYLEKLEVDKNNVFSFIEKLSDGINNYMCSIRAVICYNVNKYRIYFFITGLEIDKYYNNVSYKKELNLLINNYSQVHRFMNYSKLILNNSNIKYNIINGKTNDGTINTYCGFINNSKYFRDRFGNSSLYMSIQYFPEDTKLTLLHEKYPFWENKPGIENYIPNTDISLQSIIESLNKIYTTNFGLFKDNYIFPVSYYFSSGIKLSFLEPVYFNNKKFFAIVGVNLSDIVSESIILKGDNKITGNLSIIDENTGNNIFNVNTQDKQSYLMYNVGIGKYNPETKLDIMDCSFNDVIKIINNLSSKFNIINYNANNLKNAINNSGVTKTSSVLVSKAYTKRNVKIVKGVPKITYEYVEAVYKEIQTTTPNFVGFKTFIETQFIDPSIYDQTKNKITQNDNNYFTVTEIPYDSVTKNIIINNIVKRYHYKYPTWNDKTISEILETEIQNKKSAQLLYDADNLISNNNIFYDGSYNISYYPWINGITVNIGYSFVTKDLNDVTKTKLYVLRTGVDIQTNLTFETNKNIVKILEILSTQSNGIQRLIPTLPNYTSLNIVNNSLSKNNIDTRLINNLNGNKLFKYVIDLYNTNDITLQELDIITHQTIGNEKKFIDLINSKEDFQLRNKLTNYVSNLKYKFSAYYDVDPTLQNGVEKIVYLSKGYYGVIHMEDDLYDYFSTFWVYDELITNDTPVKHKVIIYSYEVNLEEIINTTVRVHGDTTLEGDLYINNSNTKNPFIFADSTNNFFGINTSQIYSNYNVEYSTTTDKEMATNNVYIKSKTYPNAIIERTTEVDPTIVTDQLTNTPDGNTPYYYFKNFSTLTARRQSDYYTFTDMAINSNKCRNTINALYSDGLTIKPNAFGTGKTNVYCYGADKNYEVKDKTGIVKELGCVSIGIENFDNDTSKASGAFYVNMVDTIPNTATPFERNIMYCSNDSNLYVNNVTTNGIRFGGHPDNTPTQNATVYKLWVDDLNRLRYGTGLDTDKVVNLSNP